MNDLHVAVGLQVNTFANARNVVIGFGVPRVLGGARIALMLNQSSWVVCLVM